MDDIVGHQVSLGKPASSSRRCSRLLPAALLVVEAMEGRVLLAATFAPRPFTDPFPTPSTQGQSVVTPAWVQSFDNAATFGSGNLVSGVIGNGWNGYESGAYPSFATPAALQGAKSSMTVEFWTKGSRMDNLLKGPGFTITGQGGNDIITFTMARDGLFVSNAPGVIPTPPNDGQWHQTVVTNDCRYLSMYMDGELYSRYWIGGNTANQIGPMQDGTGNVLNPNLQLGSAGNVDEVRLYNSALTPFQVKQTFENYRAYSTIRWVSPSGSGSRSGLDSSNPMSLTSALALVGPDTKLILKGANTYDGSQFLLTDKGGTGPLHDCLIMGEPGAAPAIIKVTSGSVGPKILRGGYITLRNLQFNNASASTTNALTIDTVTNPIVIDACQISSDTNGLRVNASTKVKVQNTAVQVTSTGMSFVSSPNAIVRNNTISSGTIGLSFTSTSNYLSMLDNLITGQSGKCVLIDHGSAGHMNGSTFTGDVIADNNAYGPNGGVPFATLDTTDYGVSQLYGYQLAFYRLNFPGDTGWQLSRGPEMHSFFTAPVYNNTTSNNLDLGLQAVSGNPIDTATSSSLSDLGSHSKVDPAFYDATGTLRPMPYPLDSATAVGGNAADVGAYETAAPIQYPFTLGIASTTSAAVYKPDGTLVRTLWSGRQLPAGANIAYWNGLDDKNQQVAVGSYKIKVIAHNITYTWEGVIGNNSPNPQCGASAMRPFFDGPLAMATDPTGGTAAYIAMGYQEAFPPIWRVSSTSPNQVQAKLGFQEGTNSKVITDVTTDGTRAYFVSSMGSRQGTACAGFITAWNVSDSTQVTGGNWTQIDGGNYYGVKVGNPGASGVIAISGAAVQYNSGGNLLFVAVPGDNKVYLYDKTSGAKQSTEINVTSPGDIVVTSTGDLWVISGTSVYKYSSSNSWASPIKTISGLAGPIALAYTPYVYGQTGSTGTLLVADGAASQQVKSFRNDTGASIWTYGQAGGYANGIAITNDKFQFGNYSNNAGILTYSPWTFLATQSDGAFWVYDMASDRTMKFNASRSIQTAGNIEFPVPFVTLGVDRADPTRVFGHWTEYHIDYSKALDPTNGSWTRVNYYGHAAAVANYGFAESLYAITDLKDSNNVTHTYAISRGAGQFVELTSSGIRMTGISTGNYSTGTPWWLEPDGSLTTTSPTSPTATLYKRAFTGIDLGTGNPTWAAATVVATVPYSSNTLTADPVYVEGYLDSTSNLIITHNPGGNGGNHLGAVTNGGNTWLWQALPTERLDGRGTWDSSGSQVGADHITGVVGRSIFITFRGEFWDGVQGNQIMQYYDDGLFIGQFGQSSLLGNDSYYSAVPGQASNMMSSAVVQVGNTLYLYAPDESGHGGVSRYRIDGVDNLVEFSGNVSTNSALGAPSDLSATVASSSQIDLTWKDNSSAETGFRIERATDSLFTAGLSLLTTTAANVTSYSSTGLTANTLYYYRVRATNGSGDSADSNTASGTTLPSAPAAPGGLSATASSSSQINLTWTDNSSNETGFKIERAVDSGFTTGLTLLITTAANATSYSCTGLSAGTTYYYRVRATNAGGDSANSNTASATTQSSAPAAPSNLSATSISTSQINLTWTDNSSDETGFKIERATDSNFTTSLTLLATTAANVTSYNDTGLTANTLYYYRVRAVHVVSVPASIIPSTLRPPGASVVASDDFGGGYTFALPIPSEDDLNGQGSGLGTGWSSAWTATEFKVVSGDPYNATHNYYTQNDGFAVVPGGTGYPFIVKNGITSPGDDNSGNAVRTLVSPIAKPGAGSTEFWLAGAMTQWNYGGAIGYLVLQDASNNDLLRIGIDGSNGACITAYTSSHTAVTTHVAGMNKWDAYVVRGVWQSDGNVTFSFWLNPDASDTLGTADAALSTGGNSVVMNSASIAKLKVDVPGAPHAGSIMFDDITLDAISGSSGESANSNTASAATTLAAPTISSLAVASDTGISNSDGITNRNNSSSAMALQFQVTGLLSGATVTLYDGTTIIGTGIAAGSSLTLTTNGTATLSDGSHSITATQSLGGLTSPSSIALAITIDTVAPAISSFVINDGNAQRSMVNKLTITFSEVVSLSTNALTLLRAGIQAPNTTLGINNSLGDGRTWQINFSGSAIIGGSLADGMYQFLARAPLIQDIAGNAPAANCTARFHRLFGDADGDRVVSAADLAKFKASLNKSANYLWYFDYNYTATAGTIDNGDYLQLRSRLQKKLL